MTTSVAVKRHSRGEAQAIIARLREHSFDDLHTLFSGGEAPRFEEIEGDTAGGYLAWNPKTSSLRKLDTRLGYEMPFSRWTGTRFITRFDEDTRGKGIHLYQNRILPCRFPFYTRINESKFDQNPCLAMYYPFITFMIGTTHELRKVEDGVFLGQWYNKFPWGKKHSLLSYFVLCALSS